jgi:signal transduction histidine kinase
MAYVRLRLFPNTLITMTYGIPLLVCLFYRSPGLLWSMAAAFTLMSGYKAFFILPPAYPGELSNGVQWVMQVANIITISATIHIVIALLDRLHTKQAQLESTNRELITRDEEISRQNEELQAQAGELAQQNEEIQQQSEEMEHQAEELQVQTEQLQSANVELASRQAVLETLLGAVHDIAGNSDAQRRACEAALALFGDPVIASAVVAKDGDELVVEGSAGEIAANQKRLPAARTLASVAIEHRRPAAIADLALRRDVIVPLGEDGEFRAVLVAPLWINAEPAGTLEVYSAEPHRWTAAQFRILEWLAAQCSLVLEARRLQEQMLAANVALDRQVRDRTRELQEMVNELEHFSYTITHDLRAPLRAMHGFAALLQEECMDALNDAGREYVQRITTAAQRMDQLITDALSYSKAVRQELAMVPIDPTRLIRGMVESYPMFQSPRANVEIVGALPSVLANEAGLTQCFSNLLGNAVKFVKPGVVPHIRVHADDRDGWVRLWFDDNGIGIPEAMQSRLFKMFQRLSKDYEGTGIGLALVRKVAERMGGRVGVESQVGVGSRFWVEFKRAT